MNKILRYLFIAVLALVYGGVSAQTAIFSETFDKCAGAGGNDGKWSGITGNKAIADTYCDKSGWTGTKASAASKCVQLGTSSVAGSITSPSISGITGDATLKFKVGGWKGDATNIKLKVSNGTLESEKVSFSNEKFVEITLYISNITDAFTITFTANASSKSRFFLDDVNVYNGKLDREEITYTDVKSVKDLLTNYTEATSNLNLTLTNAKVLYVNSYNGTVNTYVREGESAIELRTLGIDMPVNSIISGTVKVDLDYSYGVPYLKANTGTNNESLSITESIEAASPIEATIEDILANKYMNDLVLIKDFTFSKDEYSTGKYNYYAKDGEKQIMLYDKFSKVGGVANLTNGETYTVEGLFGAIYNNVPEILPTKAITTSTSISSLTTDAANVNAPVYNLAGQKVSSSYKGVVVKAGKKFIQK